MCAYVHKPTVFSSLSVSLRLPAGRMRRGAKGGGRVTKCLFSGGAQTPVTLQQRRRFPAISSFLPLSTSSVSFSLSLLGVNRHDRSMGSLKKKKISQTHKERSCAHSLHLWSKSYSLPWSSYQPLWWWYSAVRDPLSWWWCASSGPVWSKRMRGG